MTTTLSKMDRLNRSINIIKSTSHELVKLMPTKLQEQDTIVKDLYSIHNTKPIDSAFYEINKDTLCHIDCYLEQFGEFILKVSNLTFEYHYNNSTSEKKEDIENNILECLNENGPSSIGELDEYFKGNVNINTIQLATERLIASDKISTKKIGIFPSNIYFYVKIQTNNKEE